MKAWLKGGLIGAIIFALIGFLLNWKSYYYGSWETTNLIKSISKNLFFGIIFGFLIGWMIITIIRKIKNEKIYLLPLIVIILHFLITIFSAFLISDDSLIYLAIIALIMCFQDCSIYQILIAILFNSIIIGFVIFLIIVIVKKIKQKKEVANEK